MRVAFQYADRFAGCKIPDSQCVVPRSGDHSLVVGGQGDGGDPIPMPFQRAEGFAGVEIPDFQSLIIGSGNCGSAIGGEGDCCDRICVPY